MNVDMTKLLMLAASLEWESHAVTLGKPEAITLGESTRPMSSVRIILDPTLPRNCLRIVSPTDTKTFHLKESSQEEER